MKIEVLFIPILLISYYECWKQDWWRDRFDDLFEEDERWWEFIPGMRSDDNND